MALHRIASMVVCIPSILNAPATAHGASQVDVSSVAALLKDSIAIAGTGNFTKVGDPRSKRNVGSQIEVPTVRLTANTAVVRGYQRYDLHAARLSQPAIHHHAGIYIFVRSLLKRLHEEYDCRNMIELGCNSGLISLLGHAVGFSSIISLDHDREYVSTFQQVVSWANLTSSIVAQEFDFGQALSGPADVVLCGALIHWVYCRTADFKSSFERIFDYLFAAVKPGKYLVLEWVDPADGAIGGMKYTPNGWWPERCFYRDLEGHLVSNYSRSNFEAAALRYADILERHAPHTRTRVYYLFRKHQDGGKASSSSATIAPECRLDAEGISTSSHANDVIQKLELKEYAVDRLLRPTIEGKPSRSFFTNSPATVVLKRSNTALSREMKNREVCILKELQQYSWAPRLLCAGHDFMLTTFMGQPACANELSSHHMAQLDSMLRDLSSSRIHHNDLAHTRGPTAGAIEVLLQNDRLSLVDFGLASLNGSHAISCQIGGIEYAAGARHVHASAKKGLQESEDTASVVASMRNCSTL